MHSPEGSVTVKVEVTKNFLNRPVYKPATHEKYRWHDPVNNVQLTAAGLLLYDDVGVWVIGEMEKGRVVYTDPGGKYNFEDGDIYATIAREFCEETYHSSEITRSKIIELSCHHPPVYVRGHHNFPVYVCYVVPLTETGVTIDPDLFQRQRSQVLANNPRVPQGCYKAVELKRIPYAELKTAPLSYRLNRILSSFTFPSIKSDVSPVVITSSAVPECPTTN